MKTGRPCIKFTDEMNQFIRDEWLKGTLGTVIAASLGISVDSLHHKRIKLGLPARHGPHRPTSGLTEDKIPLLKALWNDGVSTAEIGRRLGVSKNTVIGKAHRIGLPQRLSPIQFGHEKKPRVYKPRAKPLWRKPRVYEAQPAPVAPPPSPPTRTPEMSTPVLPFRSQRKCTFIFDERPPNGWLLEEPNWCNKPVKAGSNFSYCEEHHALCSRPTPRQAAAA